MAGPRTLRSGVTDWAATPAVLNRGGGGGGVMVWYEQLREQYRPAQLERGAQGQDAAGPSRSTPRTQSTDTMSHGNSTSHQVAPALA
jgi:hypothetical protein